MKAKTVKERYGGLRRLISGYMADQKIFPDELAQRALRKEAGAIRRRLANPDGMTLGDYLRICRELQIPIEEVRGVLEYSCIRDYQGGKN